MAAKAKKPRRDVRVDRIGFVGELVKNWIEGDTGVKSHVKADMGDGDVVEGDFFRGRLDPSTDTEISASGVFKLLKAGKIGEGEFIGMIRVNAKLAAEAIEPKTLKRLTRRYPGSPRLVVDRLPGVQIELVQAVRGINDALKQGGKGK